MKLFHKTFFYILGMFAVLIIVIHVSVYMFLPQFYLNNIKKELDLTVESLSDIITKIDSDAVYNVLQGYAQKNKLDILAEINGKSVSFQDNAIQIERFFEGDEEIQMKEVESAESVITRYRKVMSRDEKEVNLQIMMSTTPVKDAKRVTFSLLPATAALSFLLSLVFSYLYSRRITNPVMKMIEVTGNMKQLKQDAYFHIQEKDEIGLLADQINQVYEQLWDTIQRLEQEKAYIREMEKQKVDFLRAASHELKTPLATLRILLENMQYNIGKYKNHEIYLPQGIEQIDRLTQMVQEILNVSKLQSQTEKELLSVKTETEKVLQEYNYLLQERELSVEINIEDDFCIEMSTSAFQRILKNLIGNAVNYSTQGGELRIGIKGSSMYLENTCEALSEEHLQHIFEAFYRPDFARNRNDGGNGLGLYIVREVLNAWNVPCCFAPCSDGMRFSMDLKEVYCQKNK